MMPSSAFVVTFLVVSLSVNLSVGQVARIPLNRAVGAMGVRRQIPYESGEDHLEAIEAVESEIHRLLQSSGSLDLRSFPISSGTLEIDDCVEDASDGKGASKGSGRGSGKGKGKGSCSSKGKGGKGGKGKGGSEPASSGLDVPGKGASKGGKGGTSSILSGKGAKGGKGGAGLPDVSGLVLGNEGKGKGGKGAQKKKAMVGERKAKGARRLSK